MAYDETATKKMKRLVKAANRSGTAIVSQRYRWTSLNGDKKLAKGIKKTQILRQPRNNVGAMDAQKKHGLKEEVTIIMARVSRMLTSSCMIWLPCSDCLLTGDCLPRSVSGVTGLREKPSV